SKHPSFQTNDRAAAFMLPREGNRHRRLSAGIGLRRRRNASPYRSEVAMKHSAIAALVLPALVAGTVIAGSAHAQYSAPAGTTTTNTMGSSSMGTTNTGTPVGSP